MRQESQTSAISGRFDGTLRQAAVPEEAANQLKKLLIGQTPIPRAHRYGATAYRVRYKMPQMIPGLLATIAGRIECGDSFQSVSQFWLRGYAWTQHYYCLVRGVPAKALQDAFRAETEKECCFNLAQLAVSANENNPEALDGAIGSLTELLGELQVTLLSLQQKRAALTVHA